MVQLEKEPQPQLSKKAKVDAANDKIRGGSLLHAATEAQIEAVIEDNPDMSSEEDLQRALLLEGLVTQKMINALDRPSLKRLAPSPQQGQIRALYRGLKDLQRLRIPCGLRIVAGIKSCMGIRPGEQESGADMSGADIKLLDKVKMSYDRITDGLTRFPTAERFKGDEIISTYAMLVLARQYDIFLKAEEDNKALLEKILVTYPLYTEFLSGVQGCGPILSAFFLSEIDIRKAMYVSSLHQFLGLSVGSDGKGMSMRKEHHIMVPYVDKDGEIQEKVSLTHDPYRKSMVVEVFINSCMKVGREWTAEQLLDMEGLSDVKTKEWKKKNKAAGPFKAKYARVYEDHKIRLQGHAKYGTATETRVMHRERMAKRYAAKIFLADLYEAWRPLEGLTVHDPYNTAKLRHAKHNSGYDTAIAV